MKLYRATSTKKYTGLGSCWTPDCDHAQAYTENDGFGGEILIEAETNASTARILSLDNFTPALFADLLIELNGGVDGLTHALQMDEDWDTGEPLEYTARMDLDVHPLPENWIDDERIRGILAQHYDWVVYEDSYPQDCMTWVNLGGALKYKEVDL